MEEISKRKSLLFISCEEAFHICDKKQYGEASFWEMLKLNLRLIWCNMTKNYVKKNNQLTNSIKTSRVECLHTSEREVLVERFNEHLKNEMQS